MIGPVLVVAAHPDDEVLGCGGTIAKWARAGRDVHVLFMTDGESAREGATTDDCDRRALAATGAADALGCTTREIGAFPDNRMDGVDLLDVVRTVERRIADIKPTTVLTHHAGDLNVDHRITHQATVAACRPQGGNRVRELLLFEVASSTEWGSGFAPNYFVSIAGSWDAKMKALACYKSEMRPFPHPRSVEGVTALARWRGTTAGCALAEAFMLGRKLA